MTDRAQPPVDPAAEDFDALREALERLRGRIQARLPAPGAPAPVATGWDWMRLFEELRRRLQMLGMEEHSSEVDEFGFDEEALRRALPLLDFLCDRYWRVDVEGLDGIDLEAPQLFVANRAGLLPWDGLMIAHVAARRHPRGERSRFLVADWLVTLPFAHATLARLGGVRACRENAERLLRARRSVIAFPEGAKGATKVFRERYRLKRFGRGGVVRTAIASGVPIVPVAVVGAEEVHPVLFKVETLARAAGLPFVPVTPTFPALGPLGLVPLPSKWWIAFGEPIDTLQFGPEAVDDELLVSRLTEELRATIQGLVDQSLGRRASVWG